MSSFKLPHSKYSLEFMSEFSPTKKLEWTIIHWLEHFMLSLESILFRSHEAYLLFFSFRIFLRSKFWLCVPLLCVLHNSLYVHWAVRRGAPPNPETAFTMSTYIANFTEYILNHLLHSPYGHGHKQTLLLFFTTMLHPYS